MTGLPVPASAEIVFEGEVPPDDVRAEGPFGEWAGYYASGAKDEPIIRVQSVLHRDDPIVLGCAARQAAERQHLLPQPAARRADLGRAGARRACPALQGVWSHEAGGGRLFNIVSIQQMYPGHAKQVGHGDGELPRRRVRQPLRASSWTTTSTRPTPTQVLWAMWTRTDVAEDIEVIKRCWSTPLDPMAYVGEDGRATSTTA